MTGKAWIGIVFYHYEIAWHFI